MKIILLIYGISWLILLAIFISSVVQKGISKNKEPWYLYALMIAFAPLFVLAIPYILVKWKKDKKEREIIKTNLEIIKTNWEKKQEEENQKKNMARNKYKEAISIGSNAVRESFINKAEILHSEIEHKNYSDILTILDKLSLPSGCNLRVVPGDKTGSGSNSHVAVHINGNNYLNLWNHIQVEDSPMGAWQVYLLNSLWHSLPFFWHGGYNARSYIFSKEDFQKIRFIRKEDSGLATKLAGDDFNVTPEIVKHEGKYYVSCCYWSDWGGLIRDLAVISIENGKVADIYEGATAGTLCKYDCQIMF